MYDTFAPELKVNNTISNPLDPAEVLGFEGRDVKLGRSAVILKEAAIMSYDSGEVVVVPEELGGAIAKHGLSVFLLEDDTVKGMTGGDFTKEAGIHTFEGGGQTASMHFVLQDSDLWNEWDETTIPIEN